MNKIRFECNGIHGCIDEYGFMRWGSMGAYLSDIYPARLLQDSITNALIKSERTNRIIETWFDLATLHLDASP